MAKSHRLHMVKSTKLDMIGFLNSSLTIANRNIRHLVNTCVPLFYLTKKLKRKKVATVLLLPLMPLCGTLLLLIFHQLFFSGENHSNPVFSVSYMSNFIVI